MYRPRAGLAMCAVVAALIGSLLASAPTAALFASYHGWTVGRFAAQPTVYDPGSHDRGSTFSQGAHVKRLAKGYYRVTLDGVGYDGGLVHVTPLNTALRICSVSTWGTSGNDEQVFFRCWDRLGHPANTAFSLNFLDCFGCSTTAYLWEPSGTTSHDSLTGYEYNSASGINHVTRLSTGKYAITFPGLGGAYGNVQVTAYGAAPVTCRVSGWGSDTPDQEADVACRALNGHLIDSAFNITFTGGHGLRGTPTGAAAYFWADQPTSPSYIPFSLYRFSTGTGPRVLRTGKGRYTVNLLGIAGTGGSVQVTAYGDSKVHCQASSIARSGTPQTVGVRCFNAAGGPADSKFSFLFTR